MGKTLFTVRETVADDGSGETVMHISAPGVDPFTWRRMNPLRDEVIAEIARRKPPHVTDFEVEFNDENWPSA
jgi:hypothetical protein